MKPTEHPGVLFAGIAIGALAFGCWVWKAHCDAAQTPDWLADGQPPQQVAAGPLATWAAARPPGLAECCAGRSAGATARRYPPTLLASADSLIRAV